MCSACEWEDALDDCKQMLNDTDYAFAEDTLQGIHDWVEENEHVTSKQLDAISNIMDSKH